ncbi:uncharacterized protein LOC119373873 [Rhipicephalus sanguineus]|uniref:uncharacterized protein LOC119373873 n=1 Tax=Rhipicephalus sanguineus TaxID=34632 RepID=UPI0020C4249D|nr:uncharacterized protein LOC119373873 [Rhipicephalus sanguineus]
MRSRSLEVVPLQSSILCSGEIGLGGGGEVVVNSSKDSYEPGAPLRPGGAHSSTAAAGTAPGGVAGGIVGAGGGTGNALPPVAVTPSGPGGSLVPRNPGLTRLPGHRPGFRPKGIRCENAAPSSLQNCKGTALRWYYDKNTLRCALHYVGGCSFKPGYLLCPRCAISCMGLSNARQIRQFCSNATLEKFPKRE